MSICFPGTLEFVLKTYGLVIFAVWKPGFEHGQTSLGKNYIILPILLVFLLCRRRTKIRVFGVY